MKKIVKFIVAALFAAVLFTADLTANEFTITASAASKIKSSVIYDDTGSAFVTITPADSENVVRYTTDGSAPTFDSPAYTGTFVLYKETLVRMAEFTPEGDKVKGIKKTIRPKLTKVNFSVKQDADSPKAYVTLTHSHPDAKIYYTTDGSVPSDSSELYTGPITITEKTKVRARAYCDGYNASNRYSKTVKITYINTRNLKEINSTITYYDEEGYSKVKLKNTLSGATIRYTTDGSAPTTSSKKYTGRVKFTEPGILRAREFNADGECVAALDLNVEIKCGLVKMTCVGAAPGTRTIKLKTNTEGAKIYYTLDGTTPYEESSFLYTAPIVVGELADVKAIAVKDGYRRSMVAWEIAMAVPLDNFNFDFSNPYYATVGQYVNKYRVANGFKELPLDKTLSEAATLRATELATIFANTRPNGKAGASVVTEYGFVPFQVAECINAYDKTPEEFYDTLVNNKEYKEQILNKGVEYTHMGVGYYDTGKHKFWVLILLTEM